MYSISGTDNIVAALTQSNRVFQVDLRVLVNWQLEEVLAEMQVPFPELTDLRLWSDDKTTPVIPDSFLDGSAPRLQSFTLHGIPFPALPKLLLSVTHLVELHLFKIPHSGYISPEAIVALLSVLSRLESLSLKFQSPQSRPDRETRRPPPSKRSLIPALTSFLFKGAIEYLEDLVTGFDTPQLDNMRITFFNQIDFDIPRLAQFINHTPKLEKRGATVRFYDSSARVRLSSISGTLEILEIAISCKEPNWQLSSIEQICNSFWLPLSTVEVLYIDHAYTQPVWKDDAIENSLWLQLLLPFTAVKDLYLSKEFAPGIAAALQELVGGRLTEVLPSLRNIFVKGLEPSEPFRKRIGQFVAARRLSNHRITISDWDSEPNPDLELVSKFNDAREEIIRLRALLAAVPDPSLVSSSGTSLTVLRERHRSSQAQSNAVVGSKTISVPLENVFIIALLVFITTYLRTEIDTYLWTAVYSVFVLLPYLAYLAIYFICCYRLIDVCVNWCLLHSHPA